MLRILHNTKYDFIKSWRIARRSSTIAFIAGAAGHRSRITAALNCSIEFTGGTLMQLEFAQPPDVGAVRSAVDAAGFPSAEIQQFGSDREFTVRARPTRSRRGARASTASAHADRGGARAAASATNTVARRAHRDRRTARRRGAEAQRDHRASCISLVVTLIYLAFRFEWRFGVAAVHRDGARPPRRRSRSSR